MLRGQVAPAAQHLGLPLRVPHRETVGRLIGPDVPGQLLPPDQQPPPLPVHIVPAGGFPLEEALDLPGTKVLMKSGRALPQVLEALESRGLLESSAMVQNCGLPGEQAAESLKDAPQSGSYFTTLLVP